MNRDEKQTFVATLTEKLRSSPNLYLADFTGISVKGMTDLRRRFRSEGAEFLVVKNTLARWAFRDAEVAGFEDVLAGPTGIVFAGEDPVSAAKVLADFQKEQENRPAVKAGVVDGKAVGADDVRRLAALPTREVLMGQVAGVFQAPMAGLVGAMEGLLYQMVGVIEALRAQRADAA